MPGSRGSCCRAGVTHTELCRGAEEHSTLSAMPKEENRVSKRMGKTVCSIPCPKELLHRRHPACRLLRAPSDRVCKPWMGTGATPALQKSPHLCMERKAA